MRSAGTRTTGRDGFALIAVLWLVATLGVLLSEGLAPAALAAKAGENRLAGTRALWAARACLAFFQARHLDGGETVYGTPVPLGSATSCEVEPLAWDERVNANLVDSTGLARVIGDSVVVASILDWIDADDVPRTGGAERAWYAAHVRMGPRNAPMASVQELMHVRGLEGATLELLESTFTIRGDGRVSPDRASARALSSVSALSDVAIERLLEVRANAGPFSNARALSMAVGLDPTIDEFRELTARLSFHPRDFMIRVHGWSHGGSRTIRAQMDVTLSTVGDQLAVSELEVK